MDVWYEVLVLEVCGEEGGRIATKKTDMKMLLTFQLGVKGIVPLMGVVYWQTTHFGSPYFDTYPTG